MSSVEVRGKARRERDLELIGLAPVAQVGAEREFDARVARALALELAARTPMHRGRAREHRAKVRIDLAHRERVFAAKRSAERAPCAQQPGIARHYHPADAEVERQLRGVHRTRAAEGEQGEVARIDS